MKHGACTSCGSAAVQYASLSPADAGLAQRRHLVHFSLGDVEALKLSPCSSMRICLERLTVKQRLSLELRAVNGFS